MVVDNEMPYCCYWMDVAAERMINWSLENDIRDDDEMDQICVAPIAGRGKTNKARLVHCMLVTAGNWEGWLCETYTRLKGERVDHYWFSPVKDYQLRTMKELHDFVESMRVNEWSEDEAWLNMHGWNERGKRARIRHSIG